MALTKPPLSTVTPGQPVTAQGWNGLVTGLSALYDAVLALGGAALDVSVTDARGGVVDTAEVVAEPLGEGRAVRALPPFGTRTAHLLVGLTEGTWRIHLAAAGFSSEVREVRIPATEPLAVTLPVDGVAVPDVFGQTARTALDLIRAAKLDVDLLLDTTGREVSRTALPAEYTDSPILIQFPDAGTVLPAGTGRVRLVVASALRRDPVVTMPSLVGLTLSEAQGVLERLGLVLGTTSVRSPKRRVEL